jgi:hypothetical protein
VCRDRLSQRANGGSQRGRGQTVATPAVPRNLKPASHVSERTTSATLRRPPGRQLADSRNRPYPEARSDTNGRSSATALMGMQESGCCRPTRYGNGPRLVQCRSPMVSGTDRERLVWSGGCRPLRLSTLVGTSKYRDGSGPLPWETSPFGLIPSGHARPAAPHVSRLATCGTAACEALGPGPIAAQAWVGCSRSIGATHVCRRLPRLIVRFDRPRAQGRSRPATTERQSDMGDGWPPLPPLPAVLYSRWALVWC